ncbi:hypothetical protein PACTADRAFT_42535 [Pachysolen tannophilus NRRL Y-2460]|uniref:AB hydrolase-1 domain-containing protein n=1 Tax=Pachysolen tannophilus NRRL Y-2460 TaxID=669874 RepID=A0A1E4TVC6_PACTA|nr:hypothetical protein PACTADRAFT_42535 [Pachysolen tannophilus NRRL Y-2460]
MRPANLRERSFMVSSVVIVALESVLSSITYLLPSWLIEFFTKLVKFLFSSIRFYYNDPMYDSLISEFEVAETDGAVVNEDSNIFKLVHHLQNAKDIDQMCKIFGYQLENHLIKTDDDQLLNIHRLNPLTNNKPVNGKVVYLHHGLLMSSEIWVTMYKKELNLPFVLCDLGYDVWLGNNRGNKYSCRNLKLDLDDPKFWDFSIDEFSIYDIPNTVDYIIKFTGKKNLTYIGFSQGSTQGLAALSISQKLNEQIDKIITISPATTPHGLHNWLINSLIKLSPNFLFLLFGKKILLQSATFWKSIIYPPLFIKVIDVSNEILFNWKSLNIDYTQKFISYYHLYSTTSVKSVCHWFQIIKSKKFQMYDNSKQSSSSNFSSMVFPTKTNIKIPILIIYGKIDSLVDIDIMKTQLPTENLQIIGVDNYEHLDLIWGRDVKGYVFDNVVQFLEQNDFKDKNGYEFRQKKNGKTIPEKAVNGQISIDEIPDGDKNDLNRPLASRLSKSLDIIEEF